MAMAGGRRELATTVRTNADPALIAQVRILLEQAGVQLAQRDRRIAEKEHQIAALTLELAIYRRIRFGKKSEAFNAEQRELFEETIDADLAAIEAELTPDEPGNAAPRKRSRTGRRAAAIQSLLATAKLNGPEPLAWLTNTLENSLPAPTVRSTLCYRFHILNKPDGRGNVGRLHAYHHPAMLLTVG